MTQALEYIYIEFFNIWNYFINKILESSSNLDLKNLNIISGELININLPWEVLATFLSVVSVCVLIYLFILFITKLLGVFVWK